MRLAKKTFSQCFRLRCGGDWRVLYRFALLQVPCSPFCSSRQVRNEMGCSGAQSAVGSGRRAAAAVRVAPRAFAPPTGAQRAGPTVSRSRPSRHPASRPPRWRRRRTAPGRRRSRSLADACPGRRAARTGTRRCHDPVPPGSAGHGARSRHSSACRAGSFSWRCAASRAVAPTGRRAGRTGRRPR
jgi:hypothetical protein